MSDERIKALIARAAERRASRRADRAAFALRRTKGLAKRHQAKEDRGSALDLDPCTPAAAGSAPDHASTQPERSES